MEIDWDKLIAETRALRAADEAAARHEAEMRDRRDLQPLVDWLEYGRTSGYRAARCSEAQELHWAGLLKKLLAEHKE